MLLTAPHLDTIVEDFRDLQDKICRQLERIDGKETFKKDAWSRPGGGGGLSRVLQNGRIIEKGGVNFSHVHGILPDNISQKLKLPQSSYFNATGVSIVIHPESPLIPIIHMNIRYFQIDNGIHWFGGGIDLTPVYIVPEDARFFHEFLQDTCDSFDATYYSRFKEWCDQYFFIKHRNESRGIGGIFFDHLKTTSEAQKKQHFEFVKAVGESFLPVYTPLMRKYADKPYSERQKQFQLFRRSRYVEFNLVYDKGTKFGLDTGGRIESILMSMPPHASWTYNYQPEPESPEAYTLKMLKPVDWLLRD